MASLGREAVWSIHSTPSVWYAGRIGCSNRVAITPAAVPPSVTPSTSHLNRLTDET